MTRQISFIAILLLSFLFVAIIADPGFLRAAELQEERFGQFSEGPEQALTEPEQVLTEPEQAAKSVMIDDFEACSITNLFGGRSNVFLKAPSKAMVSFAKDLRDAKPTVALMLRYDKKVEGGPYDSGGWCGYYTLLKKIYPAFSLEGGVVSAEVQGDVYFDASQYSAVTFWLKGANGGENFVLGIADEHWDKVGDSVKSEEIGKYLPAAKITDDWQKAVVPLDEFFIDTTKLSSIAFSFESDCFPGGVGSGTVYIDDIMLE